MFNSFNQLSKYPLFEGIDPAWVIPPERTKNDVKQAQRAVSNKVPRLLSSMVTSGQELSEQSMKQVSLDLLGKPHSLGMKNRQTEKRKRSEEKASPKLDRSGLERERNRRRSASRFLSKHFPLFLGKFADLSWPEF